MSQAERRDDDLAELRRLQREVNERSVRGDSHDDSDIFELDRRLAEAELRRPGSTLRLYYEALRPAVAMGVVILMIGLVVLVVLGNRLAGGLALGVGILFLMSPLAAWHASRPQIGRTKDKGGER
jgi:uncharacterized membrane protein YccC